MIYVYNYAYCRELKPGELHYCVLKSETLQKKFVWSAEDTGHQEIRLLVVWVW